ncbi:MAG TPA: hypothetical protein PKL52_08910, partial [Tenuifilaceae bacterium]|nr:hypothetical protein [Tenuifilaceae bacterium]
EKKLIHALKKLHLLVESKIHKKINRSVFKQITIRLSLPVHIGKKREGTSQIETPSTLLPFRFRYPIS